MKSELAALNTNWLETTTVHAGATTSDNCTVLGGVTPDYVYSCPWYTYVPYNTSPRPIRLTLPEVERLRLAAKRDAKLRAILAKFTDQIEVKLDFS